MSSVAISPDGSRALAGSIDGELKLWDIVSGKQLRSWHGHDRGAYGAVFLTDGHHAVTGSGDYTIKLWDLDSFKEVRRFEGHSGTVYALALSADGKRLGSVSLDGTARIWNMETGAEIAEFDPGTGPMYSVAFAADGTLLTGGIDRTIRDWPAAGGDGTVLFAGGTGIAEAIGEGPRDSQSPQGERSAAFAPRQLTTRSSCLVHPMAHCRPDVPDCCRALRKEPLP